MFSSPFSIYFYSFFTVVVIVLFLFLFNGRRGLVLLLARPFPFFLSFTAVILFLPSIAQLQKSLPFNWIELIRFNQKLYFSESRLLRDLYNIVKVSFSFYQIYWSVALDKVTHKSYKKRTDLCMKLILLLDIILSFCNTFRKQFAWLKGRPKHFVK